MDRDFKGIWIPKDIWLDNELKPTEKILLSEIESYGLKGCDKTNKYLENYLGLSQSGIINIINRLEEKGYITRTIIYKPGSKEVDKRILKATYKEKKVYK